MRHQLSEHMAEDLGWMAEVIGKLERAARVTVAEIIAWEGPRLDRLRSEGGAEGVAVIEQLARIMRAADKIQRMAAFGERRMLDLIGDDLADDDEDVTP